MKKVIIANFLSELGNWAGLIAVSGLLYEINSSSMGIGILFALKALSSLIGGHLSAPLLHILPKVSGQRLAMLDALSGAFLVPIFIWPDNAALACVCYFFVSILSIPYQAYLGGYVKENFHSFHLGTAMAGLEIGSKYALIFGPALMAFIISHLGIRVGIGLDLFSFLASSIIIVGLVGESSVLSLNSAKIRFHKLDPLILILLLIAFLSGTASGLINTAELPFAIQVLGGSTADFGYMVTACGLGGALGLFFAQKCINPKNSTIMTVLTLTIGGILVFAFAFTKSLPSALGLLFVFGVVNTIASVALKTKLALVVTVQATVQIIALRSQSIQYGLMVGSLITASGFMNPATAIGWSGVVFLATGILAYFKLYQTHDLRPAAADRRVAL